MEPAKEKKQTRKYIPAIGDTVKFRCLADYRERGLAPWVPFTVIHVDGDRVTLQDRTVATLTAFTVPLNVIAVPIGWEPHYTIHAEPDKLEAVLSWFGRGINVYHAIDLSIAGRVVYTPADNPFRHYAYGLTETVAAKDCGKVFRVVKIETEDAYLPCTCKYCDGTGKHLLNEALEGQDKSTDHCPECGAHLGFSTTELWHTRPGQLSPPHCASTCDAGFCWVCDGTGIGKQYLGGMNRPERERAKRTLAADGWSVKWDVHYRVHLATRETVVKDWEEGEES